MKKIITLLLIFHFSFCFSQSQKKKIPRWQLSLLTETVEPISYIGFAYSKSIEMMSSGDIKYKSFNVGVNILYNFNLQKNYAFRLSIKKTNYHIEALNDSREVLPVAPSQYETKDWKNKSSILNISPGLLWCDNHIKLNPYVGAQCVYKKYGNVNMDVVYANYDTANNVLSKVESNIEQKGGYSIGLGVFAGFSFSLSEKVFIGSEFSYSLSYFKLGDGIKVTSTDLLINYQNIQNLPATSQGYKFSHLAASIHITINL